MQEHHVTRVCGVVFLWMTHEVALPCARLHSLQQCRLQHSNEHYINMKLPSPAPANTVYSSVDYSTAMNITSTLLLNTVVGHTKLTTHESGLK